MSAEPAQNDRPACAQTKQHVLITVFIQHPHDKVLLLLALYMYAAGKNNAAQKVSKRQKTSYEGIIDYS